jgi:hypothetical protein
MLVAFEDSVAAQADKGYVHSHLPDHNLRHDILFRYARQNTLVQ